MKKLFLIVCCFSVMNSYAEEPFQFSDVVDVDGLTNEQIYQTTKIWFVDNFKSSNAVLQMDDPINGVIIGKGNFDYNYSKPSMMYAYFSGYITHTIKIQIRDSRFKITMYDFIHVANFKNYDDGWSMGLITNNLFSDKKKSKSPIAEKAWSDMVNDCTIYYELKLKSLKEAMVSFNKTNNDIW